MAENLITKYAEAVTVRRKMNKHNDKDVEDSRGFSSRLYDIMIIV